MMKRITILFVSIELLIYGVFMTMDVQEIGTNRFNIQLKFISIILCFFYTMLLCILKKARNQWVSLSFLFLICSDYFLLIVDSYTLGICTFLGVQLCYLRALLETGTKPKRFRILKRMGINGFLTGIFLLLLYAFGIQADGTLIVATLYFVTFAGNLLLAFKTSHRTKKGFDQLFAIGLVLYFLCDINVGIFNLASYMDMAGTFFGKLYQFASIAMWLFYLPGIVLITISNGPFLKRDNEKEAL